MEPLMSANRAVMLLLGQDALGEMPWGVGDGALDRRFLR
jgi:hypothetical protein